MSETTIHPTAFVDPTAQIGKGCVIKAFALIGKNAVIGEGCVIGAYTEVRAGCVLGDRVRTGSKCTLTNGTQVGEDSLLSANFTSTDKPDLHNPSLSLPPRFGARFRAGVRVTTMPGVVFGDDVVVGACSQVRHSIPSGEVWFGNPAKKHR
jgi:UDP-2-acetamido-3-amino-2,3-dideoxy-glucuronate N-acetyltransferase